MSERASSGTERALVPGDYGSVGVDMEFTVRVTIDPSSLRDLERKLEEVSEKFRKKTARRFARSYGDVQAVIDYADRVFKGVPAHVELPGCLRRCVRCKTSFGKTNDFCPECCPVCETKCVFCGKLSYGNYSIERDGPFNGPDMPLCDVCGGDGDGAPTMDEIWQCISIQAIT